MEEVNKRHRQKANYQGTTYSRELFQVILARFKNLLDVSHPFSSQRLLPSSRRGKKKVMSILQFPVQSQAHYNVNHY